MDAQGEPVPEADLEAWMSWFEKADRGVARTVVAPDVLVLTTFRGIDEATDGEAPLLFETRVFGGVLDAEEVLHGSRTAALAAHTQLVEWCRMGSSPDLGIRWEDLS
jgi:hypothetical protein